MDLLDCQTGSRCGDCRHRTASGCALAIALEDALEAPSKALRPSGLASLHVWTRAATADA